MTVLTGKLLTACAASVLLGVALSACGGGGDGPSTGGGMPPEGDGGMAPGDGSGIGDDPSLAIQWPSNDWFQFDTIGAISGENLLNNCRRHSACPPSNILPDHSVNVDTMIDGIEDFSGCWFGSECDVEYSELETVHTGIKSFRYRGRLPSNAVYIFEHYRDDLLSQDGYLYYGNWGLVGGYVALLGIYDWSFSAVREGLSFAALMHTGYCEGSSIGACARARDAIVGRDIPNDGSSFGVSWSGTMIGGARQHDMRPVSGDVDIRGTFGSFHTDQGGLDPSSVIVMLSARFTNIGNGGDLRLSDIIIEGERLGFGQNRLGAGRDEFHIGRGQTTDAAGRGISYVPLLSGQLEGPGFEEVWGLLSHQEVLGVYLANRYRESPTSTE